MCEGAGFLRAPLLAPATAVATHHPVSRQVMRSLLRYTGPRQDRRTRFLFVPQVVSLPSVPRRGRCVRGVIGVVPPPWLVAPPVEHPGIPNGIRWVSECTWDLGPIFLAGGPMTKDIGQSNKQRTGCKVSPLSVGAYHRGERQETPQPPGFPEILCTLRVFLDKTPVCATLAA